MPIILSEDERRRRKVLVDSLLVEGFAPPGATSPKGRALHQALIRTGKNHHHWATMEAEEAAANRLSFSPDWSLFRPDVDDELLETISGSSDPAPPEAAPSPPPHDNDNDTPADPKVERREAHDRDFWKAQAMSLKKELSTVEHLLEEVGGIRNYPIPPVRWLFDRPDASVSGSVLTMLLTDLHMGEVIHPDEILGLNAYNPDIAGARMRRFFNAACAIGPRWAADTEVKGLLLLLGGDLISGDIHEELKITNALTAHEQVREAVALIVAGIRQALSTYPRVHVASVPGNHSRTTFKSTAKLYSRLSYDTLIAQMVADRFHDDERVTFQIGWAPDAIVPVLGRTLLLTHGDKMGTGGGQGFAGPLLPIVRGTKKVEAQQARAGRRPDIICHGHYHHSANPGPVFSNGAFPGYSEYGHGLRASLEDPQQWLFLVHEKWGVRERCEIKLSDPGLPVGLTTLAPAEMAYAQAA